MNFPQIILKSPTGNKGYAEFSHRGERISVDLHWKREPSGEDVEFANNAVMEVLRLANPTETLAMSGTAVALDQKDSDRMTRDWLHAGVLTGSKLKRLLYHSAHAYTFRLLNSRSQVKVLLRLICVIL